MSGGNGNGAGVIAIDGVGDCYRLENQQLAAGRLDSERGKKRVVLLVETPALAHPAALVLKRAEVDRLILGLVAAREGLWDTDKHPIASKCDCPKCRAKRAGADPE